MRERQRGTAIGIERGRLETREAQEGSSRARDRATEVAAGRGTREPDSTCGWRCVSCPVIVVARGTAPRTQRIRKLWGEPGAVRRRSTNKS